MSSLNIPKGVQRILPPSGYVSLIVDSSGSAKLLDEHGTETDIGIGLGLNTAKQYVSPLGDDTNDGLTEQTARQSVRAALVYLATRTNPGGTLIFCDGALSGLATSMPGTFIPIRGDGLAGTAGPSWSGSALDGPLASTWVPDMPLEVIGEGSTITSFSDQPCAWGDVGNAQGWSPFTTDRLNAFIWLVACQKPKVFRNTIPYGGLHNAPYRVGWDFRRKADGAIDWANITSWVRVTGGGAPTYNNPGLSTVTVALPTGASITSASRVGTSATVNYPAITNSLIRQGIIVKITSSDSNFPSGDYTVISGSTTSGVTTITYDDGHSATATAGAIGTVQTAGLTVGSFIEVKSTSAQVPSGPYMVNSVTDATHFVVRDFYGYDTRTPSVTVANPGQWVAQDRSSNFGCTLWTFINACGASDSPRNSDRFDCGPTFDLAGAAAGGLQFIKGGSLGGILSTTCFDPTRAAWLMVSADSIPFDIEVSDCRPYTGGIRVNAAGLSAGLRVYRVQGDIDVAHATAASVPSVDVETFAGASFFTDIRVDRATLADGNPAVPDVRLNGAVGSLEVDERCFLEINPDPSNFIRQVKRLRNGYRHVSGSSGDITVGSVNGNAIEFKLADGTSIGVIELKSFTVNP